MRLQLIIKNSRIIIYAEREKTCKIVNELVQKLEENNIKIVTKLENLHCG